MQLADHHRESIRNEIERALENRLSEPERLEIVTALAAAVIRMVTAERQRCVDVCRARAELWLRTSERDGAPPLREESRARANEARYLADLLEMEEAFGMPDA